MSQLITHSDDSITSANVTGTISPQEKDLSVPNSQPILGNEEVELIPGTEILNDLSGIYSERGVLETEQHVILLPMPSTDPHDPLVSLHLNN